MTYNFKATMLMIIKAVRGFRHPEQVWPRLGRAYLPKRADVVSGVDGGTLLLGHFSKGNEQGGVRKERQAGDFLQGAGHVHFLGRLQSHDEGQALLRAV